MKTLLINREAEKHLKGINCSAEVKQVSIYSKPSITGFIGIPTAPDPAQRRNSTPGSLGLPSTECSSIEDEPAGTRNICLQTGHRTSLFKSPYPITILYHTPHCPSCRSTKNSSKDWTSLSCLEKGRICTSLVAKPSVKNVITQARSYDNIGTNAIANVNTKSTVNYTVISESPSNRQQQPLVGTNSCLRPSTAFCSDIRTEIFQTIARATGIASTIGQGRIQEQHPEISVIKAIVRPPWGTFVKILHLHYFHTLDNFTHKASIYVKNFVQFLAFALFRTYPEACRWTPAGRTLCSGSSGVSTHRSCR